MSAFFEEVEIIKQIMYFFSAFKKKLSVTVKAQYVDIVRPPTFQPLYKDLLWLNEKGERDLLLWALFCFFHVNNSE